ncbi:hypothetical protein [Aidingimonas halophila]|uniref:Uncharacterized protein n=1 Tax=Aidingimonas halophila TaxID=574349 RepID=A0A1H3FKB5_9GAMM|nr:hypothetical protein [Aidingimonas halophila]SDX91441.1 hypothetical protein SAMN05443545_10862 [Aidingimonas halophila]
MPTSRALWLTFVVSLLLVSSPLAMAQSAEQEWHAYQDALERGERHADYWQTGWTTFYAGSLAYNAWQSSEGNSSDDRFDARVGAVKSALALGGMLLDRQPHPEARRKLEQISGQDPDDRLARARDVIQETAEEERRRRGWRARLGSLAVNTVGGLVIGVGDDRPDDGAISFATGMLVSELQLWSQPGQAGHAINRFQPAELSFGDMQIDYEYAWVMGPDQLGVHLRY